MDPLLKTINFKPKQDAVKQEVDRNEDMIRSALRAIASLNRIRYWKIRYMNETFFLVELNTASSTLLCFNI